MKLKLDENGNVVLQDDKPVYVDDDGKEVAFDAPATVQTIARLNYEAKSHRERAESAEKTLKAFEGIADPAAAIKAMEVVANLDQKKLIDAGEVDKVKAEISKAFQAQLDEANAKVAGYEEQLYAEKIGGAFARSKLISEKFAIPADLVQARFGSAFKIEDGKTVAYDQAGNKIFSRSRPGELADFEEALETLVDQYPYKDQILKAPGNGGMGSDAGKATSRQGAPAGDFGGSRDERRAAIAQKYGLPQA